MNEKLREITDYINRANSTAAFSLTANLDEATNTVTVECRESSDVVVIVVVTDMQILTMTPLFEESSVKDESRAELNRALLTVSLPMALSSVAIQDNRYVLFGSMAIETTMSNLLHEIEVQINNYQDVLEALSDYIDY